MPKAAEFDLPDMGGLEGVSLVDRAISRAVATRAPKPAKPAAPPVPAAEERLNPVGQLLTLADRIPDPETLTASDSPTLTAGDTELRQNLEEAVEAASQVMEGAAWTIGKALDAINQAQLYRSDYSTFADYVAARWGYERRYAYRLMEGWRVALAVAAGGTPPNERQVRELVKAGRVADADSVAALYQTASQVAQENGKAVTAQMLQAATKALPPSLPTDGEEAKRVVVQATQEAVRRELTKPPAPRPSPENAETGSDGPGGGASDTGASEVDSGAQRRSGALLEVLRLYPTVTAVGELGTTLAGQLDGDARAAFLHGFASHLSPEELGRLLKTVVQDADATAV